jgi:hypothetical protein
MTSAALVLVNIVELLGSGVAFALAWKYVKAREARIRRAAAQPRVAVEDIDGLGKVAYDAYIARNNAVFALIHPEVSAQEIADYPDPEWRVLPEGVRGVWRASVVAVLTATERAA